MARTLQSRVREDGFKSAANDASQDARVYLREEAMSFLIALAALVFLMFVAYRGFSVILFAPVAALGAVLLTDPGAVPAAFTSLFMDKMVGFAKLYFPVFLLGAVF